MQVKSGDNPVDLATLTQLKGPCRTSKHSMVCWCPGEDSRVPLSEKSQRQFFQVRTWDQDTIIEELFANYDKLDAELRAELPFKRIWSPDDAGRRIGLQNTVRSWGARSRASRPTRLIEGSGIELVQFGFAAASYLVAGSGTRPPGLETTSG